MSLTSRILTGFVLLALAGLYFLLNPILDRVERQYLEAAEEPMVDAAELLAGIVSRELETSGRLPDSLGPGIESAARRELDVAIYGLRKESISMDAYITDDRGIVIFDSGQPTRVGADLSFFNDVRLTLAGEYGARSTREDESDSGSSVMYVGAPLIVHGQIVGVLSVYKPQRSLRGFVAETRREILTLGLAGIAAFLLFGFLLSRWVTEPLARLTRYAEAVTRGEHPPPPKMPGRQLRILGESLERMRDALEDRNYVASYVQTLSHEMKTPVAAIRGACELLQESSLPPDRRRQFLANIETESTRLQNLIEQLLALSSLETRRRLENPRVVDVAEVVRRVVDEVRSRGASVNLTAKTPLPALGDEFLLETAVRNLVQNALDFSPKTEPIDVEARADGGEIVITVRDKGPGIPDYALSRVFDRFYSLPRPDSGRKSSGLGLCFVRQTALLHDGSAHLENASGGGAVATLRLPASSYSSPGGVSSPSIS